MTIAIMVSLGLLFGAVGLLLPTPSAGAAGGDASSCGMAKWLRLCVTEPDSLVPNHPLRLEFSGMVPKGAYHAGDTVAISVPKSISAPKGASYRLTDPSGSVVATMKVGQDGNLVLTFSAFVDSHTDVQLQGYLTAQLSNGARLGPDTFTWTVDGTAVRIPVTVRSQCTGSCSEMPTSAVKYAFIDPSDLTHVVSTLRSATVTDNGQRITWIDTVGAGQKIECDKVKGAAYNRIVNGTLYQSSTVRPEIVICNDTKIVATYAGQKGLAYSLNLTASITDASRSSWSDSGSVTIDQDSRPVYAEAAAYRGGGSGRGVAPAQAASTRAEVQGGIGSTTLIVITIAGFLVIVAAGVLARRSASRD